MMRFYRYNQLVYHLFKRLYSPCSVNIVIFKRCHCNLDDFMQRTLEHRQLAHRFVGKMNLFFVNLTCGFQQIHRMVAESLKIADCMKQL